jgi:hypothetical protein
MHSNLLRKPATSKLNEKPTFQRPAVSTIKVHVVGIYQSFLFPTDVQSNCRVESSF